MGDYNTAFKYHKKVSNANRDYPWPIPRNKYYLDQKMLNKDLRYGGLVQRDFEARSSQLQDPVTRLRFLQGKGQVNSVSLQSLYRNQILTGQVPQWDRGTPIQDFNFPLRQQHVNWTSSLNPQDQLQALHLSVGSGGDVNAKSETKWVKVI